MKRILTILFSISILNFSFIVSNYYKPNISFMEDVSTDVNSERYITTLSENLKFNEFFDNDFNLEYFQDFEKFNRKSVESFSAIIDFEKINYDLKELLNSTLNCEIVKSKIMHVYCRLLNFKEPYSVFLIYFLEKENILFQVIDFYITNVIANLDCEKLVSKSIDSFS